jgi:hypothetical protein
MRPFLLPDALMLQKYVAFTAQSQNALVPLKSGQSGCFKQQLDMKSLKLA